MSSLQKNWDRLGETDPFWAILTDPSKKNNGWDPNEFFATGKAEVDDVLEWVARLHPLPSKTRALDFGCGVGRLTQPLADRFDEVWGVDISPSMIDRARAFDSHRRCQFVLNSNPDLRIFAAKHFDFVYSSITLQHIKPRFTRLYLIEFARVLRPGGVLVFQLPSRMRGGGARLWCRRLLHRAYRDLYRPIFNSQTPRIDMHGIEQNEVIRTLQRHALKLVESVPDRSAGPLWEAYRYLATKPEEVVT